MLEPNITRIVMGDQLKPHDKLSSRGQPSNGKPPLMSQRYLAADGQSQSGPVVAGGGSTPESLEQKWQILGVDARALLPDPKGSVIHPDHCRSQGRGGGDPVLNKIF